MQTLQEKINMILLTVAFGMAVASLVLGFMGDDSADTGVVLLGIGLVAIALRGLRKVQQERTQKESGEK